MGCAFLFSIFIHACFFQLLQIIQIAYLCSCYIQIVKENQKLHKGSVEIEDDLATLADKGVFPGDILWVRDSEIYENRDIAGK